MDDFWYQKPDCSLETGVAISTLEKWQASKKIDSKEGKIGRASVWKHLYLREKEKNDASPSDAEDSGKHQARLILAQCRKTEAEATLKELDIEERKGRLIERMAAIEEINNANARMETKMWGIPERYALELSGISDPQEIKRILQTAIDEGLAELQNNVFIR